MFSATLLGSFLGRENRIISESEDYFEEEKDELAREWNVLGALLSLPKISISKDERKQIESALVDEGTKKAMISSLSPFFILLSYDSLSQFLTMLTP